MSRVRKIARTLVQEVFRGGLLFLVVPLVFFVTLYSTYERLTSKEADDCTALALPEESQETALFWGWGLVDHSCVCEYVSEQYAENCHCGYREGDERRLRKGEEQLVRERDERRVSNENLLLAPDRDVI